MRFVGAGILFVLAALVCFGAARAAPSGGHHPQAGQMLTLEQYWELVQESRTTVAALESVPPDQARGQLGALAARWETVGSVILSNGTSIEVDSSFWVAQLGADQPDLEQLEGLFDELLAARDRIPTESFTESDIQALREVLARPEYQWAVPHRSWIQDQLLRLLDWFSRLLPERLPLNLPWLLALIAAATLVLVLGYIAFTLYRNLARESVLRTGHEFADEALTAQMAMTRAEDLSTRGDFRAAMRYLYLSALLVLDERGLLRYDHTKTNREYLRSVSGDPSLSAPLREVIDVFDRVWYGFQSLDEENYRHYAARVKELEERG
jgi:hypothetical protein